MCRSTEKIQKLKKPKRQDKKSPGRFILLSNSVVCDNKKFRFFKEQEASRLSRNLGIKVSLQ